MIHICKYAPNFTHAKAQCMIDDFSYFVERDYEKDNIKNWHYLVDHSTGITYDLPFGSYDVATEEQIKECINEIKGVNL